MFSLIPRRSRAAGRPRLISPRRLGVVAGSILITVLLLSPGPARADDGAIDHTFGSGGVVTQSLNTTVGTPDGAGFRRLILQPDGKLVAVGFARFASGSAQDTRILLARYSPDGALDRTFSDGLVLTDIQGGSRDIPSDVLRLPDGRLLVVGTTFAAGRSDVAMVRYLPNGALDPTLGAGGVFVDRGFQDESSGFIHDARANAAVLIPGTPNRVAVAGSVRSASRTPSFLLGIYDLDGTPIVRSAFEPHATAGANDIIVDPDGKLVVAGYAAKPAPGSGTVDVFEVARYFRNGDLDHPQFTSATFGRGTFPNSEAQFPGASRARANALVRQPADGRYVAAGFAKTNGRSVFALARFNATGGLDRSFGGDGMITTPLGGPASAEDVLVQSDGKILAAGRASVDGASAIALVRYLPDGRLDSTFGGDGIVVTRLTGSFDDAASGATRLSDGRLLVAGSDTSTGSEHRYLLARYGQAPAGCTALLGCTSITLVRPTTALILTDLTRATNVGILVRRLVGGRKVRVGRVPLGRRLPAGAAIRWRLHVNGRRLPPGRYLVNVRALRRGRVVEVAPAIRLVLRRRPSQR